MAIDQFGKPIPEDNLEKGLEEDLQPKPEQKENEEKEERVPFHQDPTVQLYIERQVAKRVGEGNKAWEERIGRLEQRLTQKGQEQSPNIAGWTPADEDQAKAARAIIAQAKREILEEQEAYRENAEKQTTEEDQAFTDWLDELQITGTLKDDDEKKKFANLIVEYGLTDQKATVNLWNRLQESVSEAREKGEKDGEVQGIKKAQEAKVGSARKGAEPGTKERTYNERRSQEPNFDAILDREMNRL